MEHTVTFDSVGVTYGRFLPGNSVSVLERSKCIRLSTSIFTPQAECGQEKNRARTGGRNTY
jgi:hypothetical protein